MLLETGQKKEGLRVDPTLLCFPFIQGSTVTAAASSSEHRWHESIDTNTSSTPAITFLIQEVMRSLAEGKAEQPRGKKG